jgi:hypothetical protein
LSVRRINSENCGDSGYSGSGIFYIPMNGKKEFVMSTNGIDWDMSEAYEKYASSKPSTVENSRLRPEGQDLFDWLMEDKESREITNEMFKTAGIKW